MEINKIKEEISKAIKLMQEQTWDNGEKAYCDSGCCYEALNILEELFGKL
jgi:hypothetical protein